MANELGFRRLWLGNWKNFQEIDIEVRDRMFLVGANAAGKSNLLDAFATTVPDWAQRETQEQTDDEIADHRLRR